MNSNNAYDRCFGHVLHNAVAAVVSTRAPRPARDSPPGPAPLAAPRLQGTARDDEALTFSRDVTFAIHVVTCLRRATISYDFVREAHKALHGGRDVAVAQFAGQRFASIIGVMKKLLKIKGALKAALYSKRLENVMESALAACGRGAPRDALLESYFVRLAEYTQTLEAVEKVLVDGQSGTVPTGAHALSFQRSIRHSLLVDQEDGEHIKELKAALDAGARAPPAPPLQLSVTLTAAAKCCSRRASASSQCATTTATSWAPTCWPPPFSTMRRPSR